METSSERECELTAIYKSSDKETDKRELFVCKSAGACRLNSRNKLFFVKRETFLPQAKL